MDEALKFQHEFEGGKYLTFELSKLQQPDKYGQTHTAYVSVKEETDDKKQKKPSKK